MKANQGPLVVEEAQKQLEVTRIDNTILNLQEENEAMKANQGSVVEEAQKQLEVTRIDNTILNLQEENEAMKANQGSCG